MAALLLQRDLRQLWVRTADSEESVQISSDIKLDALIPGCLNCLLHCLLYCLHCITHLLTSVNQGLTPGAYMPAFLFFV